MTGTGTLIVVVGFSIIIGKMLIDTNERQIVLGNAAIKHYDAIVSRDIANSGANIAVSEIFRNFSWRDSLKDKAISGGTFDVRVQDVNFDTALTLQRVKVTAISHFAGRNDTAQVVVARAPFSYFAQYTTEWPTSNYYGTGDTLYGPIHTNTTFKFGGSPVFFGKVSMGGASYLTVNGVTTTPQFLGGVEYGADPVPMPGNTILQALADSAQSGGDYYADHVWLNFHANGTYDYFVGKNFGGSYDGAKNLSDYNSVIAAASTKDIHVQGTVSGQLTIYSQEKLWIEDDVLYADDPTINPTSQDMLGLIAKKDVIVAYTVPNQNDVTIHAAIMAVTGKFKVEKLKGVGLLGKLTTYGSTSQKKRGTRATGKIINGNIVITNGYELLALYDNRFLHAGPPSYPSTQRATVYSWLEDTKDGVAYGVTTTGGGQGIGGQDVTVGDLVEDTKYSNIATLESIRDDFQGIANDNPNTTLASQAQNVVLNLQTALDEIEQTTPDNTAAISNIVAAQGDIQAIIDAGSIGATEGLDYINQLDSVISYLSALDDD